MWKSDQAINALVVNQRKRKRKSMIDTAEQKTHARLGKRKKVNLGGEEMFIYFFGGGKGTLNSTG